MWSLLHASPTECHRQVKLPEAVARELEAQRIKLFLGPYGVWAERPKSATGAGAVGDESWDEGGGAADGDMVKTAVPPELCDNIAMLTPSALGRKCSSPFGPKFRTNKD